MINLENLSPDLFHTNYTTVGLILNQKCIMDNVDVDLSFDIKKNLKSLILFFVFWKKMLKMLLIIIEV